MTLVHKSNLYYYDHQFSLGEVIKEIDKIHMYKASGLPVISRRIVKHAFSVIPEIIKHLFDCSIITGTFPKAWKQGTVIPLPKVANHQVPSELRPITLLIIPGKMLDWNA